MLSQPKDMTALAPSVTTTTSAITLGGQAHVGAAEVRGGSPSTTRHRAADHPPSSIHSPPSHITPLITTLTVTRHFGIEADICISLRA